MTEPTPPVALTIAGSDSGGGAGIVADLATFSAHRVFGTFALTAATAQNTEKVHDVVAFEPAFVQAQIDAVLGDFNVASAKTGMLANVAIIESLTERSRRGDLPPLVVDPVMVSTSGSALFEGDARSAYRRLIASATVVTPNLLEAEVLCNRTVRTLEQMSEAAKELFDLGGAVAVVKGGHLNDETSTDVVFDGNDLHQLAHRRISTRNTHGTGCTLSAAIAANLALGFGPLEAITAAKHYVTQALIASKDWTLGGGAGPINHFASPSP